MPPPTWEARPEAGLHRARGRRQGRLGGGTALLVLLFITIGASCAATPLCHKVLRGSQSCRSLETFFLRANVYMYKSVQLNQRVKWKS